jgi:phosphoglycolate phosphatase-like HAD superfamily hydrolase
MIELVVFDADGVLFDSFHSNIAYYNAIFEQVGEPPLDDEEEIDSISMATAHLFNRRARGNAALIERMNQVSAELEFAPFFELLKPPFDLRPFMIELKKRYKLGLATNRSATVPALVRHLRLADTFDAIASARDRYSGTLYAPSQSRWRSIRLRRRQSNRSSGGRRRQHALHWSGDEA